MVDIKKLNKLQEGELQELLSQCCGSNAWYTQVSELRPYRDLTDLIEKSNFVWYNLDDTDWKEAFSHHPKIGDIDSLREKYSQHHTWSKGEQGEVHKAKEEIIQELAEKNEKYLDKFGYIFIVFATGKSAGEMLDILLTRIPNSPKEEIEIASREQNKITRLRLKKLVNSKED